MSRRRKKKVLEDLSYTCKNCGTSFVGRFCPHCSQSVKEFEQPIGFMIIDFVGNMFAFDTRFWKTFKAVLYKPGHMSKAFVEGHRVRYMPPFRFYIFISFIFFLLLNYNVNSNIGNDSSSKKADLSFNSLDSIQEKKTDSIVRYELGKDFGEAKTDSILNTVKKRYSLAYNNSIDSTNNTDGESENVEKKFKILFKDAQVHPDYYISKALGYISWSLFLFMPFFALLLWLFFRKSYKFYVVHLIFAINQHAFLFIVLSVSILLDIILPESFDSYILYILFIPPVYHVIGAKQLYQRSFKSTIIRLLTIGFIYWTILFISIAIIIYLWLYFGYLS